MNKIKLPSYCIPLAYLDYESQFNEEIREYFLSLFDENDQIIFSNGVFCVNSTTPKDKRIFPANVGNFYGSQGNRYLYTYKYFMKKFGFQLFESRDNDILSWVLTKGDPNKAGVYQDPKGGPWIFRSTENLHFKKIDEIDFSWNGKVLGFNNEALKFEVVDINCEDSNIDKIDTSYRICEGFSISAYNNKDMQKEYLNRVKNKILEIAKESKNEDPIIAIPFMYCSKNFDDGNYENFFEWDYKKDPIPQSVILGGKEMYSSYAFCYLNNRPKDIQEKFNLKYNMVSFKHLKIRNNSLWIHNRFNRYLFNKLKKDLKIDEDLYNTSQILAYVEERGQ